MRIDRVPTLIFFGFALGIGLVSSAEGQTLESTLTLDALSFIAFDQSEALPIPAGSTVQFRFSPIDASGTARFEIRPQDLRVAPIRLVGEPGALRVALIRPTTGTLRVQDASEASISFDALLRVGLEHPTEAGSREVPVHFTTGSAQASSAREATTFTVDGMRLGLRSRAVQLVGATAGHADDRPGPGAAVRVVLSGYFDKLPEPRREGR